MKSGVHGKVEMENTVLYGRLCLCSKSVLLSELAMLLLKGTIEPKAAAVFLLLTGLASVLAPVDRCCTMCCIAPAVCTIGAVWLDSVLGSFQRAS